jgi:hypothetical protein
MKHILILVLFLLPAISFAQPILFQTIAKNDSLLFQVGFNTCDVTQFETLISEDFEFYHDKSGITETKAGFVKGIREGLCTSPYHPSRQLVPGSMEVYPLYAGDVLYGAIQTGRHRFYEQPDGQPKQFRSIARFTHLWILEDGVWRLKRGLSYDHLVREGNKDGGAKP